MSAKTNAEVVIDGKVYTLCGYEEPEYLQKVAAYINSKINEIDTLDGAKTLPANMKSVMIQLNIADDYFKAKSYIEKLEKEIEAKDKVKVLLARALCHEIDHLDGIVYVEKVEGELHEVAAQE